MEMVFWIMPPKQKNTWKYLEIPSLKLTACPWKWMVGILVSFWDGLFSGAMLVSGSVHHISQLVVIFLNGTPITRFPVGSQFLVQHWCSRPGRRHHPPIGESYQPENGATKKSLQRIYQVQVCSSNSVYLEHATCHKYNHYIQFSWNPPWNWQHFRPWK